MGLRPLFEEHCARLSKEWKVSVCAPELFPGGEKWGLDQRMKKAKTLSDEDKIDDILAAAQRTGCDTVHLVGFCMGGMYALKAAVEDRFTKCRVVLRHDPRAEAVEEQEPGRAARHPRRPRGDARDAHRGDSDDLRPGLRHRGAQEARSDRRTSTRGPSTGSCTTPTVRRTARRTRRTPGRRRRSSSACRPRALERHDDRRRFVQRERQHVAVPLRLDGRLEARTDVSVDLEGDRRIR